MGGGLNFCVCSTSYLTVGIPIHLHDQIIANDHKRSERGVGVGGSATKILLTNVAAANLHQGPWVIGQLFPHSHRYPHHSAAADVVDVAVRLRKDTPCLHLHHPVTHEPTSGTISHMHVNYSQIKYNTNTAILFCFDIIHEFKFNGLNYWVQ